MTSFRVLQFNMQFGQRWNAADPDNAPVDLEATLAEIRSHQADIILLQEVERAQAEGIQLQPPPNFRRLKAELAGYDSHFAYPKPDPRELPFGIGLAIFSRTPLTSPYRVELPSPPVPFDFKGETRTPTDRLLIGATTAIGGRHVNLVNTHLLAFFMLNSSSQVHGGQRDLLVQHLQTLKGPTLAGGDFNVRRHDSLVNQLRDVGFTSAQTAEPTWWRMPYVLDHVFYNAGLRCLGHRLSRTGVSDHHALVADFTFV